MDKQYLVVGLYFGLCCIVRQLNHLWNRITASIQVSSKTRVQKSHPQAPPSFSSLHMKNRSHVIHIQHPYTLTVRILISATCLHSMKFWRSPSLQHRYSWPCTTLLLYTWVWDDNTFASVIYDRKLTLLSMMNSYSTAYRSLYSLILCTILNKCSTCWVIKG